MPTQTYIFVPGEHLQGVRPTTDNPFTAEPTGDVGYLDILQPVVDEGMVLVRIADKALLVSREDLRKVLEHLG